jgi:FkbM family methyltransferase
MIRYLINYTKKFFYFLFFGRFDIFLKTCSGLIHVGANDAQERNHYKSLGVKKVIYIEADPEVFKKTITNIKNYKGYVAYNYLVTDKINRTYFFNVSNNGGNSSSIYDFKEHKSIYPEVSYVKKIRLLSQTLPSIVEKHKIKMSNFQALVLDTQGSEFSILKGSKNILKYFKYIKLEASDFQLYSNKKGSVNEISIYLRKFGFYEVKRIVIGKNSKKGKIFDILYSKK